MADFSNRVRGGRITQEIPVEVIGTTRTRLSHFMSKLRRLGNIDDNGGVSAHRSLLSVILHD